MINTLSDIYELYSKRPSMYTLDIHRQAALYRVVDVAIKEGYDDESIAEKVVLPVEEITEMRHDPIGHWRKFNKETGCIQLP